MDAVEEATDEHERGHRRKRDDDRHQRPSADHHPRRYGRGTAAFEDSLLTQDGDRDDEVHERRGDDRQCRDAGHVVDARREALRADLVVAEDADEDHEEEQWQDEREEPRLRVAEKASEVEARLVEDERRITARSGGPHAGSFVSSR
jgi:hypothetical protein